MEYIWDVGGRAMVWVLLLVLAVFGALILTGMRRVLVVFSGSALLRISGAALFVASVFVGLTAVFGGVALAAGVDKFPPSWLTGTLFSSYLVPGLILAVVVGGSAVVTAVTTVRSRERATLWSMLAGAILLGWLVGERLILPTAAFSPQFWWLEAIYIAVGLMMLVPAGVIWWLDRRRRRRLF